MIDKRVIYTTAAVVALTSIGTYLFFKFRKKQRQKSPPKTLVDEDKKYSLELVEKIEISHDTRKFRFRLPSEDHVLGLPIGQHVYLSAKVDGKLVVRPYTPTSSGDDRGFVELIVKIYFRDVNPKFPEGGKMSQHLEQMKIGDRIDFRGPSGLITYKGNGLFRVQTEKRGLARERTFNKVSMIAGGTGITPMLQIITAILKDVEENPMEETKIRLLFANQTEDDILCREELDALAASHPDRFEVWYTVDRPPENWLYSTGFINDSMIETYLFPPTDDNVVLLCGPPPMINFACTPNLDKLAYDPANRLSF